MESLRSQPGTTIAGVLGGSDSARDWREWLMARAVLIIRPMKICLGLAFALIAIPAGAVDLRWPEGTLRGFPAIRDLKGQILADSTLSQWIEGGTLHVKVVSEFRDGRRVEEQAELRQRPALEQLRWSWTEQRGKNVLRRFEVDFDARTATAQKLENGELKHWEESLDIQAAKSFAGIGFMYAIKNLNERLQGGEKIELTAVAFTPKPRTATVSVSHEAVESLRLGGRTFESDRILVHPEVPAIARPFVKAPDQRLWLYRAPPPVLLRAELPLAEPGDQFIRIDVVPGTCRSEARAAAPPTKAGAQ
jgi:hypothetical protein